MLFFGIVKSYSQTPIHTFTFDNTLSNVAGTVAFSSSVPIGASGSNFVYTTNRNGEPSKALLNKINAILSATFTDLPIGSSARSVECWVKFENDYSGTHYIWGYGTNSTNFSYGLTQEATNVVNYGWANDLITAAPYTSDVWYHYVTTYNGSVASVYRNGVLVGTTNKSWNTVGQTFKIGQTSNTSQPASFNATIDDLKIYNSALTSTQIQNLYIAASTYVTFPTSGLLGYYSFETNYNAHDGVHNFGVDPASGLNSVSAGISTGKFGKCLDIGFGTGAISNTSLSTALLNKQFSISCWVNNTNGNNNYSSAFEFFASAFYRYNFATPNVQEFAMAISSSSYQSANSTLLPVNEWVHITLVFDKDAANNCILKLYQNGVNIANKTMPVNSSLYQFNNKAVIGGGTNANGSINSTKYFRGLIDEVYIYDKALTEVEVVSLIHNTTGSLTPTTLSYFNVDLKNNEARLSWTTATEINTQNFEIEYSNNGREFNKVATVAAAGNSNTTKQYSYTHAVSNNPIHYYRLKMIDKDGKYTYSNIVKLKAETKSFSADVFPTIVKDNANININSLATQLINISLIDNNGRVVKQMNVSVLQGSNSLQLETKNISNGFYTVQIKTNQEQVVQRIFKQ